MKNGDFEKSSAGEPVGWESLGPGVSVKPSTSAGWNRTELVFNAGEYSRVRVWLGIDGGQDTIWFDNVRLEESEFSTQPIVNPSFEQGDAKTLTGWIQDPPGDRVLRDTTVWTRFPGQGFGSGASARAVSPDGKRSRIGQDIPIVGRDEPNRDFVLSFAWRAADLHGNVYIEIFGIQADGQIGRALPITPLPAKFPPEQFGKKIIALSLSGPGETGLAQLLDLSVADRNRAWRVSAQVRVSQLKKGSVALSVEHGSKSESASEKKIKLTDDLWQELSANFIPDDDARIAIRVKAAEGDHGSAAQVYVDNVTIGPAAITPMPKRLEWLSLDESFPIPEKLTVGITGEANSVITSAIRLFSESLKEKTGTLVVTDTAPKADEPRLELSVAPKSNAPIEPEGYSLQVGRNRVIVFSADQRGVLYGLMTLLELVQQVPSGGNVFLAAKIDDAPDLPFRGHYWAAGTTGDDYRKMIDRLARLRYNAVLVQNLPYFSLNNPASRRETEEFFAYSRDLGIEPIPVIQCFGHASHLVGNDPGIAEGMEVIDEKLVLAGTNPVALAHPNVIRTETSNIRIKDRRGDRIFLEGRDYEVIPGEMAWKSGVGFSSKAAPFKIRRTEGSRIPDGATVLADYDYISMVDDGTEPSYCPNEPRVYRIMGDAIRNTLRILHPKYLHIGHDEIMQMGTDSRCRKSGRSNAENFAWELWKLYRIAKAEDANVRVMIWDDMVNPYSHGDLANYADLAHSLKSPFLQAGQLLKDPTAPAADLLPRDLIVNCWFYGASDALTAGLKSLQFFGAKGYSTTGSTYGNLPNARGWSVACKRVRDAGLPCIGIVQTSWSGYFGTLEESANTAWRVPSGQ